MSTPAQPPPFDRPYPGPAHPFAPLTLHGPAGPLHTDWCGFCPNLHAGPDLLCGRLAADPTHTPPQEVPDALRGR